MNILSVLALIFILFTPVLTPWDIYKLAVDSRK